MPKCGSQVAICDYPVRFDTYKGCTHNCTYCFASRKTDISNIKSDESPETLRSFIQGKRGNDTAWCDWQIPIHWGGMSDGFQPIEKEQKRSLRCLEVLSETQYPCIISTKGALIAESPYIDLIAKGNIVVQISALGTLYDKTEKGAPTFEQRLAMMAKVSKAAKRLIVRAQPYIPDVKKEFLQNIQKFKDAGAHGIVIEGMKFLKAAKGTVKLGADHVIDQKVLERDFTEIKNKCHELGLTFFCGENRLRHMGDSLACCGTGDMEGFKGNYYNLNHLIYDKDKPAATPAINQTGSAQVFSSALGQDSSYHSHLKKTNFKAEMDRVFNTKKMHDIMGAK